MSGLEGPDVRASGVDSSVHWMGDAGCLLGGAECPRLREAPDVRGDRRMSGLTGQASVLPGRRCRMSWILAGFPVGSDVRAGRRMSGRWRFFCRGLAVNISRGRMSGVLAGCPVPGGCSCLLPLVLVFHGLGVLTIFMCILGRVLLVPNHAQHSGLR